MAKMKKKGNDMLQSKTKGVSEAKDANTSKSENQEEAK